MALELHTSVLNRVTSAYQKIVSGVALQLVTNLKFEAPVDEGRLAGSMSMVPTSPYSADVGSDVKYAIPVMKGIVRNPGSSQQPPIGTKGNPYADRAIARTSDQVEKIISFALRSSGL